MHPIMKHIESTSEQPCRILIADDEPLVCELMQFNLEKEGFEVDVFRNVDEAYQADLPNYNLFIIDVMMNDMMGMNFAHHLKQTKKVSTFAGGVGVLMRWRRSTAFTRAIISFIEKGFRI